MKTRNRTSAKAPEAVETPTSTAPKVLLAPESTNPPLLFILPDNVSSDARIVSLRNPRHLSEDRYYICPQKGIYEFTKVATPKTTPRSWFLLPQEEDVSNGGQTNGKGQGFITRNADFFMATPIDPLFILLPALNPPSKSTEPTKKLFLSGDDYLERVEGASPHIKDFLRAGSFRMLLDSRMKAVCDTVEAGDETMYRWSEEKLLQELLEKARNMVVQGLPASMEEKLIRKALDMPMSSIKREESSMHELNQGVEATTTNIAETDSQTTESTTDSITTSFSEASTAATALCDEFPSESTAVKAAPSIPTITAPDGVAELLRLRTAFLFTCSNYLAPYISTGLKKLLSSKESPVDFTPLDAHLAHLAMLRQEALASRSLGDYSRKRGMNDDDDETIEERAEKKRKMDEEEKRKKAGISVGLKKLQKVNTTGMKKMSDFFKKK
ncbi:ribonuclease H2, subunit B [Bisporella sp. PMI_857]|nr:ribonuclease H2, subunit B [Bisporella sp. PMI_857]